KRAYCLKTQPATGETYPKSDLFNKAVPTIKPLDEKAIIEQASKPGRLVVTAENHTAVGGLGEAVAALLMRKGVRCELDSVGLPDAFLLAGALPTLHDRYGISTAKIVEKIKYRLR
ncbi:transketolase C-terminal domain-containing protein, partial [Klebsiella pneumoniae]